MPDAPPILLLTRPAAQSARFLQQCEAALGAPADAVIAPVIRIVPRAGGVDLAGIAGVVFTSENAVAAFGAAQEAAKVPGLRAWCVGDRTAAAAAQAGFDAVSAGGDADDLIARILAEPPGGPLLHMAGAHLAADVAGRLTEGGVPTRAVTIYDQLPQALPDAARQLLLSDTRPVILPLFSPRSARLLRAEVPDPGPAVRPVAISARTAAAWGPGPRAPKVAARPGADAMVALVLAEMQDDPTC